MKKIKILDKERLQTIEGNTRNFLQYLNNCKKSFDLAAPDKIYSKQLFLDLQNSELSYFENIHVETIRKKLNKNDGLPEMSREGILINYPISRTDMKLFREYEELSRKAIEIKKRNLVDFTCIVEENGIFIIDQNYLQSQFTLEFKNENQIKVYSAIKYLADDIAPLLKEVGYNMGNTSRLSIGRHFPFSELFGGNTKLLSERDELKLVKNIIKDIK